MRLRGNNFRPQEFTLLDFLVHARHVNQTIDFRRVGFRTTNGNTSAVLTFSETVHKHINFTSDFRL